MLQVSHPTIQDYLQQSDVLDPSFLSSFKKKGKLAQGSRPRNVSSLTETTGKISAAAKTTQAASAAMMKQSSISSVVKDITNKLFESSATKKENVTAFNERSRSVLVSPTALSAYTPIK